MQSTQSDVKEYSYFAGNQWQKAADNKVFEVHEPYSGEFFARFAAGTRADERGAVDAAAKAFPSWAQSAPAESPAFPEGGRDRTTPSKRDYRNPCSRDWIHHFILRVSGGSGCCHHCASTASAEYKEFGWEEQLLNHGGSNRR